MKTQIFKAPDISCDHCVQTIRKSLGTVPGVRRAEVDIDRQEVQVDFEEDKVGRGEIESILARKGYPVSLDANKARHSNPEGRNSCCGSCHL